MTLNDYCAAKQQLCGQLWLTKRSYPQNIHRTSLTVVKLVAFRVGDEWTRRPVSRVLCRPDQGPDAAIIPLDRPSRDGSRDLPGSLGPTTALPLAGRRIPIRSCSWRGLPCRPCYQGRGALLPHPFTLPRPETGGLLSVALS